MCKSHKTISRRGTEFTEQSQSLINSLWFLSPLIRVLCVNAVSLVQFLCFVTAPDFSQLMDLGVDFAFRLVFGTGDTLFLTSLLNSVFANKEIARTIKSLAVLNPYLEKRREDDKLSILDIDDFAVFTDALELHYIDMKMFVEAINKTGSIGKSKNINAALARWLAVITEKDISDKTIIKDICEEQEEIGMAVSTLARLSQDKLTRLDYLKRQDEIMLYNMRLKEYEREAKRQQRRAEQERQKAEQERQKAEQEQRRAEAAEAEVEELRVKLAYLEKMKPVQKPD